MGRNKTVHAGATYAIRLSGGNGGDGTVEATGGL